MLFKSQLLGKVRHAFVASGVFVFDGAPRFVNAAEMGEQFRAQVAMLINEASHFVNGFQPCILAQGITAKAFIVMNGVFFGKTFGAFGQHFVDLLLNVFQFLRGVDPHAVQFAVVVRCKCSGLINPYRLIGDKMHPLNW